MTKIAENLTKEWLEKSDKGIIKLRMNISKG